MFRVFIRNWYKRDAKGNLVPGPGRKSYIDPAFDAEEEARAFCQEYNRTHNPGPLSRKAEYEEI